MQVESFSGTWSFDPSISELKSPPSKWMQTIQIEGERVHVREQITREGNDSTVEVDAVMNGNFYEVKGSPLVDEISYVFDGESILGIGRKQGVVVLSEVVSLSAPDIVRLSLCLLMGGKEIPLGDALFRRVQGADSIQEQP